MGNGTDSQNHARRHAERLQDMAQQMRNDLTEVDDPHARALFETAAEVLLGLEKACRDFAAGTESAWRR